MTKMSVPYDQDAFDKANKRVKKERLRKVRRGRQPQAMFTGPKRIKAGTQEPLVILFDTESLISDKSEAPFVLGSYQVLRHKCLFGKHSFEYGERGIFTHSQFIYELIDKYGSEYEEIRVVGFNLNWDLVVIGFHEIENMTQFEYRIEAEGTIGLFKHPEDSGLCPMSIKTTHRDGKINVHWFELRNWFPNESIKSLGEDMNLPKEDFNPIGPEMVRSLLERIEKFDEKNVVDNIDKQLFYALRDVDITTQAYINFCFKYNGATGMWPRLTSSSSSYSAALRNGIPDRMIQSSAYLEGNWGIRKDEEKSFHGGISNCLHFAYALFKVFVYDVVNMYGSIMCEKLATRCLGEVTTKKYRKILLKQIEKGGQKDRAYLLQIDLFIPPGDKLTPISVKDKATGELINPCGYIRSKFMWDEMYRFILERGYKILRVRKIIAYEANPFLREYVLGLIVLRLKAKAAGDIVLANVFKLLINGLYGKMGESPKQMNRPVTDPHLVARLQAHLEATAGERRHEIQRFKMDGVYYCHLGFRKFSQFHSGSDSWAEYTVKDVAFPHIASHITNLAQLKIMSAKARLLDMGAEIPYEETDCLHSSIPMPEDMVGKDAGMWELKETYGPKECFYRSTKDYVLGFDTEKQEVKRKGATLNPENSPFYIVSERPNFSKLTQIVNRPAGLIDTKARIIHTKKVTAGINKQRKCVGRDMANEPLFSDKHGKINYRVDFNDKFFTKEEKDRIAEANSMEKTKLKEIRLKNR